MRYLVSHGRIVEQPPGGLPEAGTDLRMIVHRDQDPPPNLGHRRPAPDHARFWLSRHWHANLGGDWGTGPVEVTITAAHGPTGHRPAEWWPAHERPFSTPVHLCPIPTCDHEHVFAPVTAAEYVAAGGGDVLPSRSGSLESGLGNWIHPEDEPGIRRALLQRLVDRAAIVEAVWSGRAELPIDCCLLRYVDRDGHARSVFICDESCDHWHHREEVWIA